MSIFDKIAQDIIAKQISTLKESTKDLYTELSKRQSSEKKIDALKESLNNGISFLKGIREQLNPLIEQELLLGRGLTLLINDANTAIVLVREYYRFKRISEIQEITNELLRDLPDINMDNLSAKIDEKELAQTKRQDVIDKMFTNKN